MSSLREVKRCTTFTIIYEHRLSSGVDDVASCLNAS